MSSGFILLRPVLVMLAMICMYGLSAQNFYFTSFPIEGYTEGGTIIHHKDYDWLFIRGEKNFRASSVNGPFYEMADQNNLIRGTISNLSMKNTICYDKGFICRTYTNGTVFLVNVDVVAGTVAPILSEDKTFNEITDLIQYDNDLYFNARTESYQSGFYKVSDSRIVQVHDKKFTNLFIDETTNRLLGSIGYGEMWSFREGVFTLVNPKINGTYFHYDRYTGTIKSGTDLIQVVQGAEYVNYVSAYGGEFYRLDGNEFELLGNFSLDNSSTFSQYTNFNEADLLVVEATVNDSVTSGGAYASKNGRGSYFYNPDDRTLERIGAPYGKLAIAGIVHKGGDGSVYVTMSDRFVPGGGSTKLYRYNYRNNQLEKLMYNNKELVDAGHFVNYLNDVYFVSDRRLYKLKGNQVEQISTDEWISSIDLVTDRYVYLHNAAQQIRVIDNPSALFLNYADDNKTGSILSVYPLPAVKMVIIKNPEAISHLALYDELGHEVLSRQVPLITEYQLGGLESLTRGVYLLKVLSGESVRTIKVIKQ